ncbi:MAG: glycosyltransferase family 2 protein [Patescibacteria group bacterium]|nr:glycosyltransferase family 2 protein [Patescibacteria group bacterium]
MKASTTLPTISLIIPCFNEAANITPFVQACVTTLPIGYRYELLFVDDGSRDATARTISTLKPGREDMTIRCLELSRNFGKEVAVTAGLHDCRGAAAVIIDADLQHPPATISKFITAWEQGAEVIIGLRQADKQYAPWVKRQGSKLFYKILNALSSVEILPNATDFRMIDRVVIDEFNRFTERSRMTRGLIDWLGFRREYVEFKPATRLHGEAAYSLRKLTGLALNSIVGMSLVPLKLAGYLGLLITLFFGSLGAVIAVEMFALHDPLHLRVANSVDLAVLIIFLIGIVLMALGLIGLYIATIHTEVANRPLYVVRAPRKK